MDEIETQNLDPAESDDLQTQFESLRHFVLSVLILVIVVTGALNIYLYYQFKSAGRELETQTPQIQSYHNAYYNGDGPAIERFVRDCMEYGKTHPDFGPYLDKYRLRPPPGAANLPPAVAPATKAPSAPPAPVKK